MAKSKNIKPAPTGMPAQQKAPAAAPVPPVAPAPSYKPWSIFDFKVQAIIVALLAFIFYINTAQNEYAHDDGIVIIKNEYVLEGFAGIPKILTKDAYDSYYRQLNTSNQLHGGRYRPLSIVTFAIEQQFMGAVPIEKIDSVLKQTVAYGVTGPNEQKLAHDMHIRHVVNVLLFLISAVVLLYFLRYIVFKNDPIMALVAAVLFTIHPIHTEVVANVKSRDEIMSLLFMCMTFIFAFKYEEHKKPGMLIAGLVSYFLAFLSKEYAITMVVLLPLALYTFNKTSFWKSIVAFLPYVAVIGVYMLLRLRTADPNFASSSDQEVLNNPYLFASVIEKPATEIATSLNYLKLLIFPHPLSADYSYDSIPYKDFSSPLVWLSLLVHGGLIGLMIISFKRVVAAKQQQLSVLGVKARETFGDAAGILCFAIAFYMLHLLLVCNIVFDIGATMGERLIYHSSVGFAIGISYLLCTAARKIKPVTVGYQTLAALMTVIIVLCGYKTISRNADWKNDNTLFTQDLKTVPNSVLVSANVAASYITMSDLTKDSTEKKKYLTDAVHLLDHTLSIHRTFVAAFLNRGIAYYKLGNIDMARANIDSVKALYPSYPTLPGMYKLICDYYLKNGWDSYGKHGKFPEAVAEYKKGLSIDPNNIDLLYNMGGAYYTNKQYPEAMAAFQKVLKLDPNNKMANQGIAATFQMMNPQMAGRQQAAPGGQATAKPQKAH